MNIFSALSQGKGKLNEENLSAMFGFLLNPRNEHGLGDLFLNRFLILLSNNEHDYASILKGKYSLDITFESPYEFDGKVRRVDVDLKFFCNKEERLRILVENKIRTTSADKHQLLEEYQGVCSNLIDDNHENIDVIMVFLTHSATDERLISEYETLGNDTLKENHCKKWILWDDADKPGTITHELKQILIDESMMTINPISEYVRHTIKAFICFVKENLDSQQVGKKRHTPSDNDSINGSCTMWVGENEYKIEEYDSGAIKVFELESGMYVAAKPIFRDVITEYKMPIPLVNEKGKKKTTRELGRAILKHTDKVFRHAMEKNPSSVTVISESLSQKMPEIKYSEPFQK